MSYGKALRVLRRFLMWLSGSAAVYAAAVFLLPIIKVGGEGGAAGEVAVYLLSNGVHTDVVVPTRNDVADWSQVFPAAHTLDGTEGEWLALGWGDKGFYLNTPTWSDLSASTALRAALGLGGSAIHATYYGDMDGCTRCAKIMLSKAQYRSLAAYIRQSLQWRDGHTLLIPTDRVYGRNDAFYEARGRYSLFYTCNTWTNGALKAAKTDAALWTITEGGIFYHYPNPKVAD
ncbi:MAG: TIGR02117 family protein [Neisseria sp.]|nr:TIGR02117 family protein [Neisseria sp.]